MPGRRRVVEPEEPGDSLLRLMPAACVVCSATSVARASTCAAQIAPEML